MKLSLLLFILLMQGGALSKSGAVAGTLRGPDGLPAAGVRVGAMSIPAPGRGVKGAGTLVSQGKTDDTGRFQLEEVPPGRYYIVAGTNLNAPTFYPGVPKMDTALIIEVRAMATVPNISFRLDTPAASVVVTPLPSPPPVNVTGRIVLKTNPNAAPMPPVITLQGLRVTPRPGLPTGIQQLQQAQALVGTSMTLAVAPDGSFNLALPDGDQSLADVSLPDGYSVVSVTSGGKNVLKQPIDVKAGFELLVTLDVGDVRHRYRLMALVLDDSSDRPLAGERVELVASSGEVVRLTVNAQGVVTAPGLLPGTYLLRLTSDGFDVPEKQVVITNGSVQVELRARKK